jgi:hypothetical protein
MVTCGECCYWGAPDKEFQETISIEGFKNCGCPRWKFYERGERTELSMVLYTDMEKMAVDIVTGKNFGCIHGEEKARVETVYPHRWGVIKGVVPIKEHLDNGSVIVVKSDTNLNDGKVVVRAEDADLFDSAHLVIFDENESQAVYRGTDAPMNAPRSVVGKHSFINMRPSGHVWAWGEGETLGEFTCPEPSARGKSRFWCRGCVHLDMCKPKRG